MNADIKNYISTCETCQFYPVANQTETLQPHDVPSRPWETVAVDLFELDGKDYMVTVDHLTNYWEIDRLKDTKSSTVIRNLKAHFARYGLPSTVVTDNGPQFISTNFKEFAQAFDFTHKKTDPHHHQSNGKAEAAVKSAKSLLRKNKNCDQFLALLNYRNTPRDTTSPSQRFFNRRTRTLLPTSQRLLKSKITTESDKAKVLKHKEQQKQYYDRKAKDLPALNEGDRVVMKPFTLGKKKWDRGTVVSRDGRSYEIRGEDGGGMYVRNRVHLRKALPRTPDMQPQSEDDMRKPDARTEHQQPRVTSSSPAPSPHEARNDMRKADARPEHQQPRVTSSSPAPSPRDFRNPSKTPSQTASPGQAPVPPPSQASPVETQRQTRSGRAIRPTTQKDFVYH
jgi:hypothetical protein